MGKKRSTPAKEERFPKPSAEEQGTLNPQVPLISSESDSDTVEKTGDLLRNLLKVPPGEARLKD